MLTEYEKISRVFPLKFSKFHFKMAQCAVLFQTLEIVRLRYLLEYAALTEKQPERNFFQAQFFSSKV